MRAVWRILLSQAHIIFPEPAVAIDWIPRICTEPVVFIFGVSPWSQILDEFPIVALYPIHSVHVRDKPPGANPGGRRALVISFVYFKFSRVVFIFAVNP